MLHCKNVARLTVRVEWMTETETETELENVKHTNESRQDNPQHTAHTHIHI